MPTSPDNQTVLQDPFVASLSAADDAAGERSSIELLSTVATLLGHKKKRVLGVSLVAGLLALTIAFLLPNTYTAKASFIPPTNSSSSSMAALLGQLSSLGGGASSLLSGSKSSGDLYVGILKSDSIASALVSRFHLLSVYKVNKESEAEKTLARHTVFTVGAKDTIVSISVTEKDPVRARDIADGYLDALRSTSGGLSLTENSQKRQFFEQRLALEKDELANAEVALKQTQEKSGFVAPAGQTASEIGAIAQLRAQAAGREVNLASLRQYDSDDNPEVVRLQSELSDLRSQIDRMEKGSKTANGGISTAQVPELELEYIRKARDVKYHETLFEIIAKQYEAARLDEAHDPTLQILDHARIPDTKSGPHRLLISLAGFIFGLFVSILWVVLEWMAKGQQQFEVR